MARIPVAAATPENLTDEQRRVHDAIVGARGGKLPGPYRLTLLHSPEVTDRWQALGEVLRHRIVFDSRQAELAIIVTAHHWDCRFVWHSHAAQALKGGVSQAVVDAVRDGKRPAFEREDEAAIHDFCRELLQQQSVGTANYQRMLDLFGARGAVELTALVGYYVMVCMALKTHDYPVPAEAAVLKPVQSGA
jgi:4-carboxymuconolactone decarboxylase